MLPGDVMHDSIDHGIRLWDKVLLCASKASLQGIWRVDKEIEKAFAKEHRLMREQGQALDDYLFDGWTSGKQTAVTAWCAANFRGWRGPALISLPRLSR